MKIMKRKDLMKMGMYNSVSDAVVKTASANIMRVVSPTLNNVNAYINENVMPHFTISGHYDSYISKACVSVLEDKYLKYKYGSTLIDVDPSFALCTASIERVKRKVSCFPELVNKTIKPGIFTLVMDEDGTRMIVVKEPILNKDDRSANGILGNIVHYSTSFFFIGKRKNYWYKKIRREIDDLVSSISKANQNNGSVRYQTLAASGETSKDMKVKDMNLLQFPMKEHILDKLQSFRNKESIYKEYQVPYRKGILLGGKPGVGKTAFAFALANHFEMECVSVNLDYFDKADGDEAFKNPNTVYIIDEIDSQLVNRSTTDHLEIQKQNTTSRRLLQLLRAMDSMDGGSIVVATTNYPERLDPALLRSGRFDMNINMDDLPYEYAVNMVKSRGCDPDVLLAGKTFPCNPAQLEQEIIEYILKTNEVGREEKISLDELGLNEDIQGVEEPVKEESKKKSRKKTSIKQEDQSQPEAMGVRQDPLAFIKGVMESRVAEIQEEKSSEVFFDDEENDEMIPDDGKTPVNVEPVNVGKNDISMETVDDEE